MTPSGPELAVVMPVYNEEKIIGEVLENNRERILIKRNGVETRLEQPVSDELWNALNKSGI